MRHTAQRLRMLTALLLICALLSACGNKGPLIRSGYAAVPSTSAPAAASSSIRQ